MKSDLFMRKIRNFLCFFICSFHLNYPTMEEQITDRQVLLGVTQKFFAHKIGLEEFELDKLLNGTLCLSPEIASSLERFLGIPASFWLSLQSAYEEDFDKSDNKGMVRTFLNFVAPK